MKGDEQKKAYSSPKLVEYGDAVKLIRGNLPGSADETTNLSMP